MEEGIRTPSISRSASVEQLPGAVDHHQQQQHSRNEVKVVKEAIILVHDARRFGVSERGLWHLNRLHSRAVQPRTRPNTSSTPAAAGSVAGGSASSSSGDSGTPSPSPPRPSPPTAAAAAAAAAAVAAWDIGDGDLTLLDANVTVSGGRSNRRALPLLSPADQPPTPPTTQSGSRRTVTAATAAATTRLLRNNSGSSCNNATTTSEWAGSSCGGGGHG
ncbi:unnamed protein product, partial [Pylaiella littoralis]